MIHFLRRRRPSLFANPQSRVSSAARLSQQSSSTSSSAEGTKRSFCCFGPRGRARDCRFDSDLGPQISQRDRRLDAIGSPSWHRKLRKRRQRLRSYIRRHRDKLFPTERVLDKLLSARKVLALHHTKACYPLKAIALRENMRRADSSNGLRGTLGIRPHRRRIENGRKTSTKSRPSMGTMAKR